MECKTQCFSFSIIIITLFAYLQSSLVLIVSTTDNLSHHLTLSPKNLNKLGVVRCKLYSAWSWWKIQYGLITTSNAVIINSRWRNRGVIMLWEGLVQKFDTSLTARSWLIIFVLSKFKIEWFFTFSCFRIVVCSNHEEIKPRIRYMVATLQWPFQRRYNRTPTVRHSLFSRQKFLWSIVIIIILGLWLIQIFLFCTVSYLHGT